MDKDYKRCSHCGRVLPLSMFSKNKTKACGLNNECKDCVRRYQREAKYKDKLKKSPLDKLRSYCRRFGNNTLATNPDAKIMVEIVEEYKKKYLESEIDYGITRFNY